MTFDRHIDHRDENEPAIRAIYHKLGVQTFQIKGEAGIADLMCVAHGYIFLVEVKVSAKARLTPAQQAFRDKIHASCCGYYVVYDTDSALAALAIEQAK